MINHMTFYQELQLSSAGSKQLIHKTTNPQEKRRHILVYNFKVYLVMAFCVQQISRKRKQRRRCYRTSGGFSSPTG
mgnify:CR=1 FL=1